MNALIITPKELTLNYVLPAEQAVMIGIKKEIMLSAIHLIRNTRNKGVCEQRYK